MLSNLGQCSIALTIFAVIGSTILPAQAALLVSSSGDNSIKQYDDVTGEYIRDFVPSGSGGLLNPQGLDIGPNGNLFVSSRDTSSIKEYSGTTGDYIGDFVSLDDDSIFPTAPLIGLTFAEDGSLFVASPVIPGTDIGDGPRNGILQYDGTTGEFLNGIPVGGGGFKVPIDIVAGGSDDNVFFSTSRRGFNPGTISEYDPTTNNVTDLPIGGGSLPFNPEGLALEGSNLFYTNNSEVNLIDLTNSTSYTFFVDQGSGGLSEAIGLTVGEDGNLYVVSFGTNSIKKYDGDTGDFLGDFVTSSSGGLDRPTYLITANVPVPEPSSVLGVMAFSGLFAGSMLRRRINNRKQLASLQK